MCFDFLFGSGTGTETLCVNTFEPFQGVAYGGFFSVLAFFFNILFLILFVLWIFSLGFSVLGFIRSQGGEGLEAEKLKVTNLWKGLSLGLGGCIAIVITGVLLGGGSPVDWPRNFGQCGPDAEIFMNFVEETNPKVTYPGDVYQVWCCPPDRANPAIRPGGWVDMPTNISPVDLQMLQDRSCNLYAPSVKDDI